jgi:hypothetical protein
MGSIKVWYLSNIAHVGVHVVVFKADIIGLSSDTESDCGDNVLLL